MFLFDSVSSLVPNLFNVDKSQSYIPYILEHLNKYSYLSQTLNKFILLYGVANGTDTNQTAPPQEQSDLSLNCMRRNYFFSIFWGFTVIAKLTGIDLHMASTLQRGYLSKLDELRFLNKK